MKQTKKWAGIEDLGDQESEMTKYLVSSEFLIFLSLSETSLDKCVGLHKVHTSVISVLSFQCINPVTG